MKQDKCIFCKIINGEVFSRKIWEDENHLAVLTPFPNTPGFTVIFSKKHYSSNVFSLPENICVDFMRAARTVAQLLDKSLGCKRTGMIVEGMAIDHAHIKLVPMHGIPEGP
ncbi:MAG: HIT family protein, partial [Bacteroidia bacterium]|nr:HIT family protein [Bacteroidia bacterium]